MILSSTPTFGLSVLVSSDVLSYCSGLSNDQAISSDCEDSIGSYSYLSIDHAEFDLPNNDVGGFILERSLTMFEVDKMVDDTGKNLIKKVGGARGAEFESTFSMLSDSFHSNFLDGLMSDEDESSDDESDFDLEDRWHDQEAVRSDYMSKPGFSGDSTLNRSTNGLREGGRMLDRTGLIKQVSDNILFDEATTIADSTAFLAESPSREGRWHDVLKPVAHRNAPMKNKNKNEISTEEVGGWRVERRQSTNGGTTKFDMVNSKLHAEIGLKMSSSLPAQKVMEAILSALAVSENEKCEAPDQ